MIVAVLSVTLMSVQAKLIGPEYHPIQIAFARGIVVLILLSPIIYKLGGIVPLYTTYRELDKLNFKIDKIIRNE